MTAHMGTIAYRENRKVYWDKDKQEIVLMIGKEIFNKFEEIFI